MQGHILVFLLVSVTLVEGFIEGFIFGSKCPIKKYSSSKYITGNTLLVHKDFSDSVKNTEKAAKDCKVHVYITGSYYQLPYPTQYVSSDNADLAIGHAFQFELRDENNGILCNKLCLSKNPMDLYEVRCFLNKVQNNGLRWTTYNSNVLSDGTYNSDAYGYDALKTDIQTKCQGESFKRQFLAAVRRMYEEEQESEEENNNSDDEKKK